MNKLLGSIASFAAHVGTAMVGYAIHGSLAWSVIDFLFWPLAWTKWLVCHEVNSTLIKHTFAFLAG